MKQLQVLSILLMFGMFAACSTTPTGTGSSDTFNNSELGFSITKPSGWSYVSQKTLKVNRDTNRLNNAELEKVSHENGDAPFLVVFARYPEPNPKNNPAISVTVLDVGIKGLPPKGILSLSTAALKNAYPDLAIVEDIRNHEVNGIVGAYTKLKFSMAGAEGQQFLTTHRMWLVPRGTLMFSIAMAGPQEGPDVSEETFDEILKSIKISK